MLQKYALAVLSCLATFFFVGATTSKAQSFEWAARMAGTTGGHHGDSASRSVLDISGNLYVTGVFDGTEDFKPGSGTTTLTVAPSVSPAGFVVKLDSAGKLLWAKRVGSSNASTSVAVDGEGSVVLAGTFRGTVDFDPGPEVVNLTTTGVDTFVVKLDSAGAFVWARKLGGPDTHLRIDGSEVATDDADNIYVAGTFSGTEDFDPGLGVTNLASAGEEDIFVSKLDSAGRFVWAKRIGNSFGDQVYGLAVDSNRYVHITGNFSTIVDFNPGPGVFSLRAGDSSDAFVLKLDSAGHFIWARNVGTDIYALGYDIAVDSAGNVVTTGSFYGSADFDPGAGVYRLNAGERNNTFVLKLDNTGSFVWARNLNSTRWGEGLGIAVDRAGDVYTTGYFRGTADFDPGRGSFTMKGYLDAIFVWKLTSSGLFAWAVKMGGAQGERGESIAVDASGVYTAGSFFGTADFDPGPAVHNFAAGDFQALFVSKLSQP
ncbi:MAG: SBBP repeat-containing protein [Actinomycetota bacterium]|nr:SBBP repeat-containing protein [Actinomycetota bacterium]